MPQGEIIYINSVGGFRQRKVDLDPKMPVVVRNNKDSQAHALDDQPVFGNTQSVRFENIQDLLAADPTPEPLVISSWSMVCADNAVWPISPKGLGQYIPDLGSDIATRWARYDEYTEEAKQNVIAEAANKADGLLTKASVAFMIIAMAGLTLAGVVGVLAYIGKGVSV